VLVYKYCTNLIKLIFCKPWREKCQFCKICALSGPRVPYWALSGFKLFEKVINGLLAARVNIQSTLDISNSDISNSAKLEASN